MRDAGFLHRIVRDKFITDKGILLDFAQPLPTASDIRERFPNYMGWFTPIENGAFFTGLYLYSLLDNKNARMRWAEDIRTLKNGLCALQDAAEVPGFIPRGLADDGVSHYPFSSDDQLGPFLLGLWKYRESELCCEEERRDIDRRIMTVVESARDHAWRYVTEIPGVLRGGCTERFWRNAVQRLFLPFIAHAVTGDPLWLEDYESALAEKPSGSPFSRDKILRGGFAPDMIENPSLVQFWIFVSSHLMQREMALRDESVRSAFTEGLRHNGLCALPHTGRYRDMGDLDSVPFGNWRDFEKYYDSAENHRDPNAYGYKHASELKKVLPGRSAEHSKFAHSVFAAWICATSGCREAVGAAAERMESMLRDVRIEDLRTCYAFAAECAVCALESAREAF